MSIFSTNGLRSWSTQCTVNIERVKNWVGLIPRMQHRVLEPQSVVTFSLVDHSVVLISEKKRPADSYPAFLGLWRNVKPFL